MHTWWKAQHAGLIITDVVITYTLIKIWRNYFDSVKSVILYGFFIP